MMQVTDERPTAEEMRDLDFADRLLPHLPPNSIALAKVPPSLLLCLVEFFFQCRLSSSFIVMMQTESLMTTTF